MLRSWLIGVCLLTAIPTVAIAQVDGEALTEGGFNVDLVTGPVLGSGQIVGLGGGYTALALGIDGAPWNPAAYASRAMWATSWFDWDVSFSVSPGTVGAVDFDNDGRSDAWRSAGASDGGGDQRFQYGAAGLNLQFGAFGAGLAFRSETYRIALPDDQGTTEVGLSTFHYGAGYTFLEGQLVFGAGARTAVLTITAPQGTSGMQTQRELISFTGTSLEAGMVLGFSGQRWRLGAATRLPVVSVLPPSDNPPQAVGVSALPKEVHLPWEVQAGLAWQFGPRPLNLRWANPHSVRDKLRRALRDRQQARAAAQWQLEQREARLHGAFALATVEADPRVQHPTDPEWWRDERVLREQEQRDLANELEVAERRREQLVDSLAREYLLLTGEIVLVGATDNGVGVDSFLGGVRQTSGAKVSVGFRAGGELEPVAHWLKLRGGTYFEPSRYSGRPYRVHATAGFDVRLFTWDLFGLLEPFTLRTGATLDAARRYTSFGINLGVWH